MLQVPLLPCFAFCWFYANTAFVIIINVKAAATTPHHHYSSYCTQLSASPLLLPVSMVERNVSLASC